MQACRGVIYILQDILKRGQTELAEGVQMAQVVPSGPNSCQSTSDWISVEMKAWADFEAKNREICFTNNPNPPSEIIIAIVGAINQDYPDIFASLVAPHQQLFQQVNSSRLSLQSLERDILHFCIHVLRV